MLKRGGKMSEIKIDIEDSDGNTICGLIIERKVGETHLKLTNLSIADAFEDKKTHAYRLQMIEKYSDSVVPCM